MDSQKLYPAAARQARTPRGISLNVTVREFYEEDEGRYFVAECVELPGCISQGRSVEEAKANIADALNATLHVVLEDAVLRAASSGVVADAIGKVVANANFEVPALSPVLLVDAHALEVA